MAAFWWGFTLCHSKSHWWWSHRHVRSPEAGTPVRDLQILNMKAFLALNSGESCLFDSATEPMFPHQPRKRGLSWRDCEMKQSQVFDDWLSELLQIIFDELLLHQACPVGDHQLTF
jgi:hypothetical protein